MQEQYPRASEDTILFNVPEDAPEQFRDIYPYWPEGAEIRVVSTVPDPPPLDEDEAEHASQLIHKCLLDFLDQRGLPKWDELNDEVFGKNEFAVQGEQQLGFSIDRTMIIILWRPNDFTPELIKHIQRNFVQAMPLWRTGICGEPDQDEITIYHDVIRVGDVLCPPADLETTCQAWQRRILLQSAGAQETLLREIRRLRYLKRNIARFIKRLEQNDVILAGVFEVADRGCVEYWATAAFLVEDATRDYTVVSPDEASYLREYPIETNGRVGRRGGHWGTAPHRLLQFNLPVSQSHTVVIAEGYPHGSGQFGLFPGGRQWEFKIEPDWLMSDEQLQHMEADPGLE